MTREERIKYLVETYDYCKSFDNCFKCEYNLSDNCYAQEHEELENDELLGIISELHKKTIKKDEKLKELIDLFDFFKDYDKKREISEIIKIEMSEYNKIHYKDALTKFVRLVNAQEKFKNDGSLEEHIEMKIWLIVNKYK